MAHSTDLPRWKGIASFIDAFRCTVPERIDLPTRQERSGPGIIVYADDVELGIVVLLEDETHEQLHVELWKLYQPGVRRRKR